MNLQLQANVTHYLLTLGTAAYPLWSLVYVEGGGHAHMALVSLAGREADAQRSSHLPEPLC